MALYERIRELCYEKKISVRELEDQMGFSHGADRATEPSRIYAGSRAFLRDRVGLA